MIKLVFILPYLYFIYTHQQLTMFAIFSFALMLIVSGRLYIVSKQVQTDGDRLYRYWIEKLIIVTLLNGFAYFVGLFFKYEWYVPVLLLFCSVPVWILSGFLIDIFNSKNDKVILLPSMLTAIICGILIWFL